MLLHDSFFYSSNQSINETHYTSSTMAHSPLFHSTLTLILSIFGVCSNLICLISLWRIISRYKQPRSSHLLSHKKYRFLVMLTSNDLLLCLSSIISCLDEKFYSQSLVASYHLCSLHILIWKFTLHFTPLLTIFILCRYFYISYRKFPVKYMNTTALTQLLCTDLCALIPFVIALAWSVDGLWLWGEINIRSIIAPALSENHTEEMLSPSMISWNREQSKVTLEQSSSNYYFPKEKLICYLQTNDNIQFTARLLHLIRADFVLLCLLHFIGFFLEILLHIRLCCCLIARKITPIVLREQQLSLYMLYLFICFTLTSLPFYLYRTFEILFDLHVTSNYYDIVNSRILAQIILFGTSFKPILYVILTCPSRILFRYKFYASVKIESRGTIDDVLVGNQQQQLRPSNSQHTRYSLKLTTSYSRIQLHSRTSSNPVLSTIKD